MQPVQPIVDRTLESAPEHARYRVLECLWMLSEHGLHCVWVDGRNSASTAELQREGIASQQTRVA
jgi:hypothetical protein